MTSVVFRKTALNPLLTGALLYLFTRAPEQYKQPALDFISKLPAAISLPRILTGLKTLLAWGIVRQINTALNAWSFTHYQIFAQTQKWNWSSEVAVVTGGSMGIGKGIVDELFAAGVRVAILDIADLPKEYLNKDRIYYIKCDVTSLDDVKKAGKAIRAKYGHPTILVNNAGANNVFGILEVDIGYMEKLFKLNVISHWYTLQEFLPHMIETDKGHVVGVASMASFIGMPGIAGYAAHKAGVLALQEALASELKHVHHRKGILVTTVHPAFVQTPLVAAYEKETGLTVTGGVSIKEIGQIIGKQIFSCRGAQIIVPDRWHVKIGTIMRALPNWLQEGMRDMALTTQENTIPILRGRLDPKYS